MECLLDGLEPHQPDHTWVRFLRAGIRAAGRLAEVRAAMSSFQAALGFPPELRNVAICRRGPFDERRPHDAEAPETGV
jgi:hypothetical protein